MDDKEVKRRELYELARAQGIDVHHKTGIAKLQEVLVESGIPFEAYNDDTAEQEDAPDMLGANKTDDAVLDEQDELAELRDKLTEAEAAADSPDDPHVKALREQLSARVEGLDKKLARKKASTVRKSERVNCVALKKFHVQKTDLGMTDHQGSSIKVTIGQKMLLPAALAASLEARGQVSIA